MKFPPPVLLALAVTSLCTAPPAARAQSSEPITLSWRVGTTVDSLEREYFGLFRNIRGFRSATISNRAGAVVARFSRAEKGDTELVLSPRYIDGLGRYIDNYERIVDEELEMDTTLMPATRPNQNFQYGSEVRFETVDGVTHTGYILHADGRGVVLSPAGGYRSTYISGGLDVVPASSIDRVVQGSVVVPIVAQTLFTAGSALLFQHAGDDSRDEVAQYRGLAVMGSGLVIYGVLDVFGVGRSDLDLSGRDSWLKSLPSLESWSVFWDVEAPELSAFADSALTAANSDEHSTSVAGEDEFIDRFAFTFAAAAPVVGGNSDYHITPPSTRISAVGDLELNDAPTWSIGIHFETSHRFEAGLEAGLRRGRIEGDEVNYERTNELWAAASGDFSFYPRRRRSPQPLEILVGGGIGFTVVSMDGRLQSPGQEYFQTVEQTSTQPLAFARFSLRLNVTDAIAVESSILERWVGVMSVEEYSIITPTFDEIVRTVTPHGVSNSGLLTTLGLRMRI